MNLPEYKVITEKSIYDIYKENGGYEGKAFQEFYYSQDMALIEHGFHPTDISYKIHFFDSKFFDECTEVSSIDDAIECLAIKDGADVVQYENGNYGYVAYYNGSENGFEILGVATEEYDDEDFDDSEAWEDDSDRGCKDCPPDECTGHCMSCYYRPV